MSNSRLAYALAAHAVRLPQDGTIALFRPPGDYDLSALPVDRVVAVQGFRPDHDRLAERGVTVQVAPPEDFAAAVVVVPRSRAEAQALIATAAAHGGPMIVDGLKVNGVESLLRALRSRGEVSAPVSKAHGKCFTFTARPGALDDWQEPPLREIGDGWVTAPGAFSADGPDPGSVALAQALPERMAGRVADLGAGWGWLAAQVLEHEGVVECALVEAEHSALEAARTNVRDPRASFHWADARTWTDSRPFDHVVTNPPFHTERNADPSLGRAFIAASARLLGPRGTLWMVANRHLPYEGALHEAFAEVAELPGPPAFKLLRATRSVSHARSRHGQ